MNDVPGGFKPIPERAEATATEIVDAAVKVHRTVGRGLLERAYQRCLGYELRQRGCHVEIERPVDIVYENLRVEDGYRLDLFVDECVVVEVKTVPKLAREHTAQVLTYLHWTDVRLGFLLNFHAPTMRDGLKRIVR